MTEELYNKIDKFCNETDWKKYPTYEHALEDFINGILTEKDKQIEELCQTVNRKIKDIRRLEAQIEKMKCCGNCKHHHFMGDELKCYLDYDTEFECLKTKQSWELAK